LVSAQNDERAVTIDKLSGEINHLHKRAESQGRDLKRIMKENAATLSEFEKALIRKSGECDDLGFKMLALKEQVTFLTQELQEAQQSRMGNILRNFAGATNNTYSDIEEPQSTASSILQGTVSSNSAMGNGNNTSNGTMLNHEIDGSEDTNSETSSQTAPNDRRLSITSNDKIEGMKQGMKQGMKGLFSSITKLANTATTPQHHQQQMVSPVSPAPQSPNPSQQTPPAGKTQPVEDYPGSDTSTATNSLYERSAETSFNEGSLHDYEHDSQEHEV
jgi:hypothetical protein